MTLSYATVENGSPARWLAVLHGILGSKSNWRSMARQLVELRPDWGVVLVDLRLHGESKTASPPHGVRPAANDLVDLRRALSEHRPTAVLGHSFGGKVALAWADLEPELSPVILVDSNPARREGDTPNLVTNVLDRLAATRFPVASRNEFIDGLLEAGISRNIAAWLAMNLEPGDGGFRFRLDIPAIQEMMADYFRLDLWPALENRRAATHIIVAGRSWVFQVADRKRLVHLAEHNAAIHVHEIPDAGHFVHIDAPDRLLDILTRAL